MRKKVLRDGKCDLNTRAHLFSLVTLLENSGF